MSMSEKKTNLPSWPKDPLCQRYVVFLYNKFAKLDGDGKPVGRKHWADISNRLSDYTGLVIDREELKRHSSDIRVWAEHHSKEEELDEDEIRQQLWQKYPQLKHHKAGAAPKQVVTVDDDEPPAPKSASKPKTFSSSPAGCSASVTSEPTVADFVQMAQLGLTYLQQLAESSRKIAVSVDKIARVSGGVSFQSASNAAVTVMKAKSSDASRSTPESVPLTKPSLSSGSAKPPSSTRSASPGRTALKRTFSLAHSDTEAEDEHRELQDEPDSDSTSTSAAPNSLIGKAKSHVKRMASGKSSSSSQSSESE